MTLKGTTKNKCLTWLIPHLPNLFDYNSLSLLLNIVTFYKTRGYFGNHCLGDTLLNYINISKRCSDGRNLPLQSQED